MKISGWTALMAALLLGVSGSLGEVRAADVPTDTVRLSANATVVLNLPFFLAADEGLFLEQHLNVEVRKNPGASATVVPSLVRGDLDVAAVTASPSIYNQFADGFNAMLVSSISEAHKGWDPMAWLVVRQDLWDAKQIRSMKDIKGKRIDGGVPGGESDYLTRQALERAGIAKSDVQFTELSGATSDMFARLYNKASDVVGAYEPTVTQIEQMGVGHRLISIADIEPGFQETYIAVSPAFLKTHRDVLRRFLIAVVKAMKQINDAGGKWTPPMVASLAKWSGMAPEIMARLPSPPYYGAFGAINIGKLVQEQHYWHAAGLVKKEVSIDNMVDTSVVAEAKHAVGLRR